jgi:cytochrome b561
LHWLTAGLVAAMVPAVLMAQALTETDTDRAEHLAGLHILCGLGVLALTLPRLAIRLFAAPPLLETTPPLRALARLRALVFYALLLTIPLTGIFKLTLSGLDVMAFGWTLIPAGQTLPGLARRLNTAHAWLAWGFMILIFLHILAAIWHRARKRVA